MMYGRESVVGKSTRYRLHGPGTESQYSRDFPCPFRHAWRLNLPPVQWVPDLSRNGPTLESCDDADYSLRVP